MVNNSTFLFSIVVSRCLWWYAGSVNILYKDDSKFK